MAGQDELVYRIVFTADETSLKEVQDQVNAIQQTISKAKPGEGGIGTIAIDAQASIKSLVQLDGQIKATRGELKSLDTQRKDGIELTQEQLAQEQQLKVELKATSQAYNRQTQSLASIAAASSTAATTYNELVARNKALSAELRDLPLDDTTGKLQELQKQYKENNDRLKQFDAQMGNHQRNVGNYEGALKNVVAELGSMQGASGEVAKGVGVIGSAFRAAGPAFDVAGGGVRGFGAALKATGIGLIIPLISGLVSILGQIQPVVDVANRVIGAFSITLKTIADRFLGLVKAGQLFAQGKFGQAADAARESFSGLGAEIRANVSANDQLIVSMQKLELAENELTVARAQANRELAKAKLESRDATKTAQERIDALQRAIDIEEGIAQREMDLARQRFEALKQQTDLTTSSREELAKLAESEARVIELETASIQRQSEAVERLNTLRKELIAETPIIEEDLSFIEGIGEKAQSAIAAEVEFTRTMAKQMTDARISELERSGQLTEALQLAQQQRQAELQKQYEDQGIDSFRAAEMAKQQADAEFSQARINNAELEAEAKKELNMMAAQSILSVAKSLFGESKAFSIAEAIMNTYQGATKALASAPPPFNFAAAASVVAAGLANVRKIIATKPGSSPSGGSARPSTSRPEASSGALSTASLGTSAAVGSDMSATMQTSGLSAFANRGAPSINVEAKIDREGMAIAVREGEQGLLNQTLTYQ